MQLDKYRQMGIMEGQLLVYVRTGSSAQDPGAGGRYALRHPAALGGECKGGHGHPGVGIEIPEVIA